MASNYWVLIQSAHGWQVGCLGEEDSAIEEVSMPPDTADSDVAGLLVQALETRGYAGEPTLLAIDSSVCLVASMPLENPSQARNRQALLYDLEQWLPLASEDLIADHIPCGAVVLSVAVETASIKPLVDDLERRDVRVESISPAALLALQNDEKVLSEAHIVLWGQAEHVDMFVLQETRPLRWHHVQGGPQAVIRWLGLEILSSAGPRRVIAHNIPPELSAALALMPDLQIVQADSQSIAQAALAVARGCLCGDAAAWIELRRDAMASSDPYRAIRRPLTAAAVAAAVFLAALAAALLYHGYRGYHLAAEYQDQQAAVFREIQPGQPLPTGIKSRLESEHAKLAGLKGESKELPRQRSALLMLHDVLSSLPDDLRYRVLELRLERGRIQFEGEVRSHGDADVIASALHKRGYHTDPPRSQQLGERGVSVRMTAALPSAEAARQGGGP